MGISLIRNAPVMNHLLFVDDCFICMKFGMEEEWILKWFLEAFCHHSGIIINFKKLDLFVSLNMSASCKEFLSNCLGVKLVAKPGIYLGAHLDLR